MQKPKGYWTKERCHIEASKYSTKADFRRGCASGYSKAKKMGWLSDICSHMVSNRRPDGYWNKARVIEEAKKYKTRTDFSRGTSSAYNAAQANGWLDQACSHMTILVKPPGYWTKERCQEAARSFSTRSEFLANEASAFRIAQRKGWLDDICHHMHRLVKETGYWSKSKLTETAKKYTTRKDFYESEYSAYSAARSKNLLDEICSHMEYQVLPRNYWTKDRVFEEAKKYQTRGAFEAGSGGAYGRAQAEGWLDEACEHMEAVDHGWLHCIYALKNKRLNKAYIGLTRQEFSLRMKQHESAKNTTNSSQISREPDTEFEQITPYEFLVSEVGDKEQEYIDLFARQGWEIINSDDRVGHVGTQTRWTRERCAAEANKYSARKDFRADAPRVYDAAKRHGFLDSICSHMTEDVRRPVGYWTKERCMKEAMQCKTRAEFHNSAAYQAARRNGWATEVMQSLPRLRRSIDSWTKAECLDHARKYLNRTTFSTRSPGPYKAAKRNGWLDEVCQHMEGQRKNREAKPVSSREATRRGTPFQNKNSWTLQTCISEANKYTFRSEFKKGHPAAYQAARKRGWLDIVCKHMTEKVKPVGYWTLARCSEEAQKYLTKSDFVKSSGGAYAAASRNGWMDEISRHMLSDRVPRGHWNIKENCHKAALECVTRSDFKKLHRGAYRSAEKNQWLDDICSHMKEIRKPNNYWNRKRCSEEAKRYSSRAAFRKGSNGAFVAAEKKGWLDQICNHMSAD